MTKVISNDPKIYVACLASYNNGVLHGTWIDCTNDEGEIWEQIHEMLRESKYPNVEVDCPTCVGCGTTNDVDMPLEASADCTTCKGTGKVPSAEEWAIHDSEGWCGYKVSEHEDISELADIAAKIEEHGEPFALWVSEGNDADNFQYSYRGTYESFREFSDDYVDECLLCDKNIPDVVKRYFDYDSFANDLEHDFNVIEGDEGVHVFDL